MPKQRILLVEDNSDHAELAVWGIGLHFPAAVVDVAGSAEEGCDYLLRVIAGEQPLPDLALLDINLPGMSGLELLRWIKSRGELSRLKAVMLTTSSAELDKAAAAEFDADSYLTKPLQPEDLLVYVGREAATAD